MQEILRKIIVVHHHIVAKKLPRGHRVKHKAIAVVLYTYSRVQHIAPVNTLTVLTRTLCSSLQGVVRRGYIGSSYLLFRYYLTVWETILVHILIIGYETEIQPMGWIPQQTGFSTKLVELIGTLTIELIGEETVLSAVESRKSESRFVAQLCVMSYLCLAPEFVSEREFKVCALINKRILTIKTYQSAFGIHSIERSLRAVKHINTVYIVSMEVERTLALNGHIVYIHSHRRRIYTRTYATHIHRRCVTRAIFGHYERRNESRKLPKVLRVKALQLQMTERSTVQRLLTQAISLFRVVVDIYFFNVVNAYSVVNLFIVICQQ